MAGASARSARNRSRSAASEISDADPLLRGGRPKQVPKRFKRGLHGAIRLVNTNLKLLLILTLAVVVPTLCVSFFYHYVWIPGKGAAVDRQLKRVAAPLSAQRMTDLPQFQGDHKESLYWGTYRPHAYLGIRSRTPKSLLAGLMWIGMQNGQFGVRHFCQDGDEIKRYGWLEHNGRDYGRQEIIDRGLKLTTSFIKVKGNGSGYGGDWAVRIEADVEKTSVDDIDWGTGHLFFYMADEAGNSLKPGREGRSFGDKELLAYGSRKDVGGWELHLSSKDNLETHFAGFRTLHVHNLTELMYGAISVSLSMSGRLELSDTAEKSSNILVFQISGKLPFKSDISFVSGTEMKDSKVENRVDSLTGTSLYDLLRHKQKDFDEKYARSFSGADGLDSGSASVGKAAIANLLGGIGYFYGQSKISLPKGLHLQNGDNFVRYWPSPLFTAVPSRSFFPRGFLWDEGFHQLLVWRWDLGLCLDILGHWLDLINEDGWIPREQILGDEALSKVPSEFVLQHPTNGNPPTLFLVIRELVKGMKRKQFSNPQTEEISTFLERAFVRLEAWTQWFNRTQSGKEPGTYYWHGRDNTTTRELNPKTLSSGFDDYPRASHPDDHERHVDLRCWMLLAADCMHSIAEHLSSENKDVYKKMLQQLSDFETLNRMHLDNTTGAYFDFGNHTEKVRLRWFIEKRGEAQIQELLRETLEAPKLQLVPHVGYVSLFPFFMGIIPPESEILGKQLELISNHTSLWSDYGLRSLARTSSMFMKRNTEHDPPYWRGPVWMNMNYMALTALRHYSQADGPHKERAGSIYEELRGNLIRNVVQNYERTGFLWEQYNPKNRGKGKGARPFTGWTSLIVLIMGEVYPDLTAVQVKTW
ncbi:glucosidase 1 [Wolffia australiana]